MKKQKYLFNEALRRYKRYIGKLNRLLVTGRNEHRQGVLRRHITRLESLLNSLHLSISKTVIAGGIAAVALFAAPQLSAQVTFDLANPNPLNGLDVGFRSTPTFVDVDGDGDLDLVSGETYGTIKYYQNDGTGIYTEQTGAINPFSGIDVGSVSIPTFIDFDSDGDMDLVIGELNGTIKYFQNDGIGAYPEQTGAANPFNGIDVEFRSSPTFVDVDGDGDLDLVSGEYFGTIKYYQNNGSGNYTAQTGAANPFNGIDVGYYSGPTFVDLDGDGDLDLVSGEEFGTIRYYQNDGSGNYTAQTGAANPFNGFDVGKYSTPTFVDVDGDGDLDLVSGQINGTFTTYYNTTPIPPTPQPVFALFNPNPLSGLNVVDNSTPTFVDVDGDSNLDLISGRFNGIIRYYQNDGAGNYTQQAGAANPFSGFDPEYVSTPTFVDVDGDGDLDLVSGNGYGEIKYYKNDGAENYSEQTGAANPFSGIDVGYNSSPTFADVDSDGDIDLISGEFYGTIKYYQNDGAGNYSEQTGAANPFDGIDLGTYSNPTFANFDGDGDIDLIMGDNTGRIIYYTNDGTGNYTEQIGVNNPFDGFDVGYNSTPTFVDLDGDGDMDLVSGNKDGNFIAYENNPTQNQPPTAVCQNFTAQLDATGNVTITGADVDAGSTDPNIGDTLTLSVSPDTFDCNDIGTPQTVTLTVDDGNGGTDTCTATVTIANDNNLTVPGANNVDGSLQSPFTSLERSALLNVPTGRYYFTFNNSTFQGELDNDTDGGGWLMILNYVHQAGTNPDVIVRTTELPLLGTSTLGTNEGGSATWGHFSNALAASMDFEELRFYGQTSRDVDDIISFTTQFTNVINYVQTGQGSFNGISSIGNHTLLPDHAASVPQDATDYFADQNNSALTEFPFFISGQAHWGIKGIGNRWEVDDFSGNAFSTIHRVWVRGANNNVVIAPELTVNLAANGTVTVDALDVPANVSVACGDFSASLSQTTFSCADLGSNIIQYTAMDDFGHTETINVVIIVEDPLDICCQDSTEYTATGWSNGVPTTSKSAIFSADYNTTLDNIEACSVNVTNGSTLTIEGGTYVNIQNNIINDGTIQIDNEGSLVQVNDGATVTNNGTINVEKITPTLNNRDFMIVGSPMTAETRNGVHANNILFRNHVTGNFIPNQDVATQFPNAENFADDNGDNWLDYTGTLNPGESYLVLPQATVQIATPASYIFNYTQGTLNNGVVTYNGLFNTTQNGSPNQIANPYASAIDAEVFMTENADIDVLYFWEHLSGVTDYPGYNPSNYSMGDISLYSQGAIGGIGVAAANGGNPPTQFIASGQGFAFKASSAFPVTFNNSMRVTGNNDTYTRPVERELVWLRIANEQYNLGSSSVIGFSENTTDGFDQGTDVTRLATPVSLYSQLETGEELAINALSAWNEEASVNMSFSSQIETNEVYTISLTDFEGTQMEGATVYVIDNQLGTTTNLSEGSYNFTSGGGTFANRFTVVFKGNSVLGTTDNLLNLVTLYPNPTKGNVTINAKGQLLESVEVIDIRGRVVQQQSVSNQQTVTVDLSQLATAVYLLKIKTENGSVTKRVIKQ